MTPRLLKTVRMINDLVTQKSTKNLAIVSHSGFLSLLMAFIDVCTYETRWLRNGEWRSLTVVFPDAIDISEYKAGFDRWLDVDISPTLEPRNSEVGNAAKVIVLPEKYQENKRITFMTSDTLASVSFSISVKQRAVVCLPYPLPSERCQGKEFIDSIISQWSPIQPCRPTYISTRCWDVMQAIITPPFILNGTEYIYQRSRDTRILFHGEGQCACAHIVLICRPQMESGDSTMCGTDLPVWVGERYLERLYKQCLTFRHEMGALSVTVIVPHDS
eukprot:Gregarina_sp_Poly_1__2205@NODE_1589_length_3774_cov_81_174535_g865_i1_p1_GENE_NODE_1589_length_3774_cov_81_174535_g865_i1NODE_1589_length_3774_cov_81_174535_g865_i1_p1_ORF_typecomplete_len274_score16_18His_Phos_1/PF00300_22/0_0065_NODE_1589_length_3774_cov_81_174535_g865_i124673288